jgi:hypothetical protein
VPLTAFQPSALTDPVNLVAGGAGAGKTSFSSATLQIGLTPVLLNSLDTEFSGRTSAVNVFLANNGRAYARYSYRAVAVTEVALHGVTATVSFVAGTFGWAIATVNPDGSIGAVRTSGWSVLTNSTASVDSTLDPSAALYNP